mmetsp:Transcript_18109/g.22001  ORF Transcript_18109/g.22001 Transcript_18109/m.22001 type:complete len:89 (-) Transcript_18109:19-285(-)
MIDFVGLVGMATESTNVEYVFNILGSNFFQRNGFTLSPYEPTGLTFVQQLIYKMTHSYITASAKGDFKSAAIRLCKEFCNSFAPFHFN